MSEQSTIMGRIGNWFKAKRASNGSLPVMLETPDRPQEAQRKGWFGPSKKEQATALMVANMQQGIGALNDLMGSIRDNLDAQGKRQDELLKTLTQLPQMLASIPEANKLQGETLKAIHVTLTQQNLHQEKLTDILEKVGETTGGQTRILEGLRGDVEQLSKHDAAIVDNMSSVGSAMQTLSRNTQTGTQVLETLRDNMNSRDGQIERILHRQAARFTTMLAVAIFLSVAAIVAVAFVGFQMLKANQGTTPQNNPPAVKIDRSGTTPPAAQVQPAK